MRIVIITIGFKAHKSITRYLNDLIIIHHPFRTRILCLQRFAVTRYMNHTRTAILRTICHPFCILSLAILLSEHICHRNLTIHANSATRHQITTLRILTMYGIIPITSVHQRRHSTNPNDNGKCQ